MDNKKLLVGGLAVIGGLALVAYLLKPKSPKQNSEGFFGANGRTSKVNSNGGCRVCESSSGLYYGVYGQCRRGDACRDKL